MAGPKGQASKRKRCAPPAPDAEEVSSAPSGSGRLAAGAAGPMVQVMAELAEVPVAQGPLVGQPLGQALANPDFVESAARWRGGGRGKQVAAAMAKVTKALQSVRPGFFVDTPTTDQPPAVTPLPWWIRLQQEALHPSCRASSRSGASMCQRWAPKSGGLVVMAVVGLAILFPKLIAALLIMALLLLLRAISVVAARVFAEIWRELADTALAGLQPSCVLEYHLVWWLDSQSRWWGPVPASPPIPMPAPMATPMPSMPTVAVPTPGATAPPDPNPFAFFLHVGLACMVDSPPRTPRVGDFVLKHFASILVSTSSMALLSMTLLVEIVFKGALEESFVGLFPFVYYQLPFGRDLITPFDDLFQTFGYFQLRDRRSEVFLRKALLVARLR